MNRAPTQPHDFPPHALGMLTQLIAMMGRRGATRIYRVPIRAAVDAAQTTNGLATKFRRPGTVLGIYGTTLGATAAEAAGIETAIQISGSENLITDGDAADFASYRALFGDAQNWFPIDRRVEGGDQWFSSFRNVSGAAITPSLYFAQIEDR